MMEYIHEAIFLGIDTLILALCIKEYYNCKHIIKTLKDAPELQIDQNLKNYVDQQSDHKVPYAVIRGSVQPIGAPLTSIMSPSVAGVIQIIKLNEHRIARGFAGFWTEQRKLVHVSTNEIPFKICNGKYGVEVVEGLSADILDLDLIHDSYEPTRLSVFDHIFGFMSGIRQRGFQTTEEILRDGSFITAVGEIESDGKSIRIQGSDLGPLFLTTVTKGSLIKKFEETKSSTMFKILICGTISLVLSGLLLRKWYRKRKQLKQARQDEERLKQDIARLRRERPISGSTTLVQNNDALCIICYTNRREIIFLPCGHVALCANCADAVKFTCPICRADIIGKQAVFIV